MHLLFSSASWSTQQNYKSLEYLPDGQYKWGLWKLYKNFSHLNSNYSFLNLHFDLHRSVVLLSVFKMEVKASLRIMEKLNWAEKKWCLILLNSHWTWWRVFRGFLQTKPIRAHRKRQRLLCGTGSSPGKELGFSFLALSWKSWNRKVEDSSWALRTKKSKF